ncbi:MAG: hypothetical protein H6842_11100 [Rhodospirillaceae bacterium]|nr:hypothetical protein [Rhodospirillaceae bacterium]
MISGPPHSLRALAGRVLASLVALGLLAVAALPGGMSCEPSETTALADVLAQLTECPEGRDGCTEAERILIVDASEVQQRMRPEELQPTTLPAGDRAGMRHLALWGTPSPDVRQRFQLAALADDPALKRQVLEPLLQDTSPEVRLRTRVELGTIALRLGDPTLALTYVADRAEDVGQPAMRADAVFLEAMARQALGERERSWALLAEAVELDPTYWDAWLQLLSASLRELAGPRLTAQACQRYAATVLRSVAVLPALADNTRYFRQIADHVTGTGGARSAAGDYAAALAYAWVNDRDLALASMEQAAAHVGRLPRGCAQVIAERIARDRAVIAALSTAEGSL